MDRKKGDADSVAEINDGLRAGLPVIAEIKPVQPDDHSPDAGQSKNLDAVTSATLKNTLCIPQIPVMMPPLPPVEKEKK